MKKLIALMALATMFAVGCAKDRENKGGTSDENYSTSGTTSDTGKMQDKATTQSQTTINTTNSNSGAQQQP